MFLPLQFFLRFFRRFHVAGPGLILGNSTSEKTFFGRSPQLRFFMGTCSVWLLWGCPHNQLTGPGTVVGAVAGSRDCPRFTSKESCPRFRLFLISRPPAVVLNEKAVPRGLGFFCVFSGFPIFRKNLIPRDNGSSPPLCSSQLFKDQADAFRPRERPPTLFRPVFYRWLTFFFSPRRARRERWKNLLYFFRDLPPPHVG